MAQKRALCNQVDASHEKALERSVGKQVLLPAQEELAP